MLSNTPIEKYIINGRDIYVKREDMCCSLPSFSKLRGVEAHLKSRSEKTIGVLDTFHSKAGWGTALLCKAIGKKCIVFYPVYKHAPGLRPYQKYAKELGASLVGLDAGRSFILYQYSKSILREKYPLSYMMPNALKLPESIKETAFEVRFTPYMLFNDTTWIISVSSGTIASGVLKGIKDWGRPSGIKIVLHEGYSRPEQALLKYINQSGFSIQIVDEGYEYKDRVNFNCPFPCNPYYDLKAWKWLVEHLNEIKTKNILFWNIGI